MTTVDLDSIPSGARIIVCGGRHYGMFLLSYNTSADMEADRPRVMRERERLTEVLGRISPDRIACGGAPGADRLAVAWAREHDVEYKIYLAKWKGPSDKSAGPIRNRFMFKDWKPEGIVAFPGGTGTRDMCSVGKRGGVWVARIDWE